MKMFRKLASVFLSLSVLAAIPQVKAEEIPEPTNDSEEIVPAEETSEPAVSEESSPEKTDQEETGTEVISETAEPEPTGTEEMVPQAPDQEAADQEEAETEVTEEEKEEADREPLAEAEEGSQAMEDGIVMPAEFVLPAGYSNPIPVTVTIPGKTAEDLVFTRIGGLAQCGRRRRGHCPCRSDRYGNGRCLHHGRRCLNRQRIDERHGGKLD